MKLVGHGDGAAVLGTDVDCRSRRRYLIYYTQLSVLTIYLEQKSAHSKLE
jgi:hypothetical protein